MIMINGGFLQVGTARKPFQHKALITLLTLTSHWFACVWGLTGRTMNEKYNDSSWITALEESKGRKFDTPIRQYVASLYMSVMTITTVGYGDVGGIREEELWVATGMMIVGTMIFAYLIGELVSVVGLINEDENVFKQSLDELNVMMIEANLPKDLCKELRSYMIHAKRLRRIQRYEKIFAALSPTMQGEVAWHAHRDWLPKVWYFRGCSYDFVVSVAKLVKRVMYAPGERIALRDSICVVNSGVVARIGRVLTRDHVWGEDFILQNDILRRYQPANSLTYSVIAYVERSPFFAALALFPEDQEHIRFSAIKLSFCRALVFEAKARDRNLRAARSGGGGASSDGFNKDDSPIKRAASRRSEEHTSELQSP